MAGDMPRRTLYHRFMGWHAPELRRTTVVLAAETVVTVGLLPFIRWEVAVLIGWNAAALAFLGTVWVLAIRLDGGQTARIAAREDNTRAVGALLLLSVCVASLVGSGFSLALAASQTGRVRFLLIGMAAMTVIVSWLVLNTVFALRYAHLYYGPAPGSVAFEAADPAKGRPDYRDFAYLAFTIGMTFQVSDTTLRDQRIRRSVLSHALLAYLFGVVIVAGAINLIAGLLR